MIPVPNLPLALEKGLRSQKDYRNNNVIHVSDLAVAIGEKCPRQLWLRLQGAEEKPKTAGQLLMFDHGHRIHERIVDILQKGLEEWTIDSVEQKVVLPGPVFGTYDCLITDGTHKIIVDFKTVRGRAFNFLNEAKPSHVLQVQAYVTAVNADGGLVFYVDREGQNQAKQFYIPRDDEKVFKAIEETQKIIGKEPEILKPRLDIKKNKGPDSVKLLQPWQCDYCEYQDVSCDGALPAKYRNLGIIGYIDEGFKPKQDLGEIEGLVNELLEVS